MSNYYICTAIPYVNGDPHLGHAMEYTMADVLARYHRKLGDNVIFQVGTDEHGGKIAEKAKELGKTPAEFADGMVDKFKVLHKELDISYDRFIRTTDKDHEKRSQQIWKDLEKDIYKGTYTGWYCTGCEEYYPEAVVQANNGVCPLHNRKYEKLEEENYFFKLSQYTEQIREAVTSGKYRIIPISRRNEILSVLKEGLEDISISRPKAKLSWGIPVPGDTSQVMYVWFEALLNYITVLGYPDGEDFKKFWPANVQIIGKDILRFHAAIWPGILLGLGLPLPKILFGHGFININGKKMSKSLDNYIAPDEIVGKYGTEAFRYFFLRHIPSYDDGDFTWERFDAAYNNELADQLGNTVQRTVVMLQKYQDGLIGDIPEADHDVNQYREALDNCHFDKALDEVWEQVKGLNQYIDEQKPWVMAKNEDREYLREVLAYIVGSLLEIADLLEPFMPQTSKQIKLIFSEGFIRPMEGTLFPKLDDSGIKAPPAAKIA